MILNKRLFFAITSNSNLRGFASRPEHAKLRQHLINCKKPNCLICQRKLPIYLLECSHIKPRSLATRHERHDYNIVNWMCRICHKIYDKGDIGIKNSVIHKNSSLDKYTDLELKNLSEIDFNEYLRSKKYFDYHFKNIFNEERDI
ncbi:hypothetical protein CPAV1605_77 [seawater metagenome]|uniref:HNH nuclease domain-containing protein n=1 Tax=seawater metagenome TaxID=1561972 RepID=A0A5E8CKR1_9ZZZZ